MERPKRKLTKEEGFIIKELWNSKRAFRSYYAYVTTVSPIPMGSTDGEGPWGKNPARIIPTGTTLKIVMISRFGDVGLTDNLDADRGYGVRLDIEDAAITNIRFTKDIKK